MCIVVLLSVCLVSQDEHDSVGDINAVTLETNDLLVESSTIDTRRGVQGRGGSNDVFLIRP